MKNERIDLEKIARGGVTLLFDYQRISKDDLNYYLKFAAYYEETFSSSITGNVILKGAHSFQQNALRLLRDSNYNVNLAMRKILFPVVDIIHDEEDVEMNDGSSIINQGELLFNLYE